MLRQTFKIVFYLTVALFFGIIITLVTDSIENVTVEKKHTENARRQRPKRCTII